MVIVMIVVGWMLLEYLSQKPKTRMKRCNIVMQSDAMQSINRDRFVTDGWIRFFCSRQFQCEYHEEDF
jgi:hypothetical protein